MSLYDKFRFLTAVRFAVYAALPLFLIYVCILEVNLSGRRTYFYSFSDRSPDISQLFPQQRLAAVNNGGQRILDEPVYFTVRYPLRYERVVIRVNADNPDTVAWKLGIEKSGGGGWSYELVEPDSLGQAEFILSDARVVNHRIRFVIGVSSLTATSTFGIRGISVTLYRKPLW